MTQRRNWAEFYIVNGRLPQLQQRVQRQQSAPSLRCWLPFEHIKPSYDCCKVIRVMAIVESAVFGLGIETTEPRYTHSEHVYFQRKHTFGCVPKTPSDLHRKPLSVFFVLPFYVFFVVIVYALGMISSAHKLMRPHRKLPRYSKENTLLQYKIRTNWSVEDFSVCIVESGTDQEKYNVLITAKPQTNDSFRACAYQIR